MQSDQSPLLPQRQSTLTSNNQKKHGFSPAGARPPWIPGLPVRYYVACLLSFSQLLCVPLFSVTVPMMSTQYTWDKRYQGHIHSAFFSGYALTGLPGGLLSDRKGSKWVMFWSFLIMGCFITLTPFCASVSERMGFFLIVNRVFMGCAEGVQGAAIVSSVSTWFPRKERSTMLASINGGQFSGCVIAFILAPAIIGIAGWQSIWYLFGGLILCWCFLWAISVTSYPQDHPAMTEAELLLIQDRPRQQQQQQQQQQHQQAPQERQRTAAIPLWTLLTCPATIAIVVAQFCHDWAWYAAISWLPTYFVEAHNISVQLACLYSAFPFLVQLVVSLVAGRLGDAMVEGAAADYDTILVVRRMFSTVGFIGAGVFFMASQLTDSPIRSVVAMCLAFAFNSLHVSGYAINPMVRFVCCVLLYVCLFFAIRFLPWHMNLVVFLTLFFSIFYFFGILRTLHRTMRGKSKGLRIHLVVRLVFLQIYRSEC
jgi:sugar phosphate permease